MHDARIMLPAVDEPDVHPERGERRDRARGSGLELRYIVLGERLRVGKAKAGRYAAVQPPVTPHASGNANSRRRLGAKPKDAPARRVPRYVGHVDGVDAKAPCEERRPPRAAPKPSHEIDLSAHDGRERIHRKVARPRL